MNFNEELSTQLIRSYIYNYNAILIDVNMIKLINLYLFQSQGRSVGKNGGHTMVYQVNSNNLKIINLISINSNDELKFKVLHFGV